MQPITENLAQYEAAGLKLLGDRNYMELIKKGAGIFVPNNWRGLVR